MKEQKQEFFREKREKLYEQNQQHFEDEVQQMVEMLQELRL